MKTPENRIAGPNLGLYDIVDYRQYEDSGVIDRALNKIGRRLERGLSDEEKLRASQTFALWLDVGENPVHCISDKYLVNGQSYTPRYVSLKFTWSLEPEIKELIATFGPGVVEGNDKYLKRRGKASANCPKPTLVPGDEDLTDPKRGIGRIGGSWSPTDPRIEGDNQSLHLGPGYDY